jgi:hypothetical protein
MNLCPVHLDPECPLLKGKESQNPIVESRAAQAYSAELTALTRKQEKGI